MLDDDMAWRDYPLFWLLYTCTCQLGGVMAESVTNNPARERYEIYADGELAGFVRYRRSGNMITFIHTQADQKFRGRGVAARLVAASLDDARKQGLDVLPFCPFVRDWLAGHPEYADLIPAPDRATFGL